MWAMSAPATKALPVPVITSTRTSSSLLHLLDGLGQLLEHADVHGVEGFGPVDGEERDSVACFCQIDVHADSPTSRL